MTRRKSHTLDSEKVGKYKVSATKWHASHTHGDLHETGIYKGYKITNRISTNTHSHPCTKVFGLQPEGL